MTILPFSAPGPEETLVEFLRRASRDLGDSAFEGPAVLLVVDLWGYETVRRAAQTMRRQAGVVLRSFVREHFERDELLALAERFERGEVASFTSDKMQEDFCLCPRPVQSTSTRRCNACDKVVLWRG